MPQDPLLGLIDGVAAGRSTALASLYDQASPRVHGLALRITRDEALAEEVTLETFQQAWTQAQRYEPTRGQVLTWLLTIARSRALDRIRRRRRHESETPLEAAYEVADEEPGPEELASRSDEAVRIRTALRELPAKQREAIEIAFFGGLSHAEVAETLGEPLGTIKTRIRSGLQQLRVSLAALEGGRL